MILTFIRKCDINILKEVSTNNEDKSPNVGNLNHFRISFWSPGETYHVVKITSNKAHVLNLLNTGGSRINVFYTLLNYNSEARSSEAKMSTRDIGYASNWGQGGYLYKLKIKREYFWDGDFYLDGSWSPDRK